MPMSSPHALVEIGYSYLLKKYNFRVVGNYVASYITDHSRISSTTKNALESTYYPKQYALTNPEDPLAHLEFALKHEGVNLELIVIFFSQVSQDTVTTYIQKTPTGKYSRIIWFLFEYLLDRQLDIPDIKRVPYVNVLEPTHYYVAKGVKSTRHAVNNNLLGNRIFCPMVRKTKVLQDFEGKDFSGMAKKLMEAIDPNILARATNFLYTKETKSSFGIEKIKPDLQRTNKFIHLLEAASKITALDKETLIKLQNNIVDDAYKDVDYRKTQNYVGELTAFYEHQVHYISPKPTDLDFLMSHFLQCEEKLFDANIPPIVIAAILSFGFVFMHPFEDGNGRIHRFIIHYVLSKTGYCPENMIFPVSSVMLKNMKKYDGMLETFSKPLLQAIRAYILNDDGVLSVQQDTRVYYQYIDFTKFAEFLFECVDLTIQHDFKEEIDFIVKYDNTKIAIQAVVDMPDIKIDRIIRCIAQNNGSLGKKMRDSYFKELNDAVIESIEKIVRENML